MIRPATEDDLPQIVEIVRGFHGEANQPQEFDENDMWNFMAGMIGLHDAIVLMSGNGFICGIVTPSPVNQKWKIAMELCWYARDMSGFKLLREFENTAKEMGVSEIRISHRATTPKVGRYLNSKGYRHDETVHTRIV